MKIQNSTQISELTTMRLGGAAKFLISVEKPDEVQSAFEFAQDKSLPFFIIGSGANLIGRDEGYHGVLIKNSILGHEILEQTNDTLRIKAFGGEIWDDIAKLSVRLGFSGAEAMAKIPGTVGAAPVQNIGAYGQEVRNIIESVNVYDIKDRTIKDLSMAELGFDYRRSIFNLPENKNRFFIISVVFRFGRAELKPPFYISLQKYIDENSITDFSPQNIYNIVAKIRSEKIPDPKVLASSGSFFKNIILQPSEAKEAKNKGIPVWETGDGNYKIYSGWLIENCNLKGKEIYGFYVNDKASLILINKSATTYADLVKAKQYIIDTVYNKFGFTMEQEPVEIF